MPFSKWKSGRPPAEDESRWSWSWSKTPRSSWSRSWSTRELSQSLHPRRSPSIKTPRPPVTRPTQPRTPSFSACFSRFLESLPPASVGFDRHCSEAMAGSVVVFDFDKTIIDCDSDNWVVDGLGATELFDRLLPTMPWNTLMDTMMAELHAQGKSVEGIENVLRTAPLDPHIVTGIRTAHALGCELKIVSDANMFFIETILKHHGLTGYFSEINTNPSYVDEEGRLRISPYHDVQKSSHGCPLCPPNMCKSAAVERIQASAVAEGKKRIIYLGDGKGDYCSSLRLTEADYVMPRKNYPLWELISEDPSRIKAQVREWSNGEEQERTLLQIVRSLPLADDHGSSQSQLLSVDCKLETVPMAAHDAVLQALRQC